jgi:hypothetical protein
MRRPRDEEKHFAKLMQAGKQAHAVGNRERAHRVWRRAAMIRPYDEQVWLALLKVVDSVEDKRVCLENIVAINPDNFEARDRLALLDDIPEAPVKERPRKKRGWWR